MLYVHYISVKLGKKIGSRALSAEMTLSCSNQERPWLLDLGFVHAVMRKRTGQPRKKTRRGKILESLGLGSVAEGY